MFLLEALVQQPFLEVHSHRQSLLEVPIGPVFSWHVYCLTHW